MLRAHAVWAAEQPRVAVRVWLSILAENPSLRHTITYRWTPVGMPANRRQGCLRSNLGKNFVHPRSTSV
jgi:hypothetical protein